jgi:hypothetical protein
MERSTWKSEENFDYFKIFRPISSTTSRDYKSYMKNEELLIKKIRSEESGIEEILNKKTETTSYSKMKT